jgi:hypothetical protein
MITKNSSEFFAACERAAMRAGGLAGLCSGEWLLAYAHEGLGIVQWMIEGVPHWKAVPMRECQ